MRAAPGNALAAIPDAAAWFSGTWSALRLEREVAWRRHGANPAQILGLWGLGMIEALVSTPQTGAEKIAAMWSAVEQVFREARLVEPRLGRDFWSQAIARLFALWPQSFAVQGGSPAATASLGRALAPYPEISGDFMAIIVSLAGAGISSSELDQAVQHTGLDLLQIIARFFETARGLENARVWNPAWVAALRTLERKIADARATGLTASAAV
jgi:hypothetical protein